jgi:hypothetical protein
MPRVVSVQVVRKFIRRGKRDMKASKKFKECTETICSMTNNRTKLCTFEKCERFEECYGVKNGK